MLFLQDCHTGRLCGHKVQPMSFISFFAPYWLGDHYFDFLMCHSYMIPFSLLGSVNQGSWFLSRSIRQALDHDVRTYIKGMHWRKRIPSGWCQRVHGKDLSKVMTKSGLLLKRNNLASSTKHRVGAERPGP